jgi:Putative metallopeptidase
MYALTCLAYGSDPDLFSYVVEKNYLPQARARGCKREWGEVDYAFQQLIYPFVDKKLMTEVLSKPWVPRRRAPPPPRTTDMPQSAQEPASQH